MSALGELKPGELPKYSTDTKENRKLVIMWMDKNIKDESMLYADPFDMAVDCAHDLSLLEFCEVNGDNTFIPIWIVAIAETFFAPEVT